LFKTWVLKAKTFYRIDPSINYCPLAFGLCSLEIWHILPSRESSSDKDFSAPFPPLCNPFSRRLIVRQFSS